MTDQRGGIWHHANHPSTVAQLVFQLREWNAGGDGNEQMFFGKLFAEFREDRADLIWFHREDQNVRKLCDVGAEARGFCADVFGERLSGGLHRNTSTDLI